jgi:uncharacterized membrane protein YdjX (TVP38/TMEM64 family)
VISSFWQWIPLEDLTSTEEIQPLLENLNQNRFGPAIIMSLYVIGGLVFFPVTIMITITAAVFGPVTGFIYALGGSMLSAITSFLIGAKLNRSFLNSFLQGRQFQRLNRIFSEYGVFSVVFVRMVPVAPFTVVNLIAGMSNIQTRDFLYGTVIGMVPGILMLTLVGDRLRTLWESPSLENYIVTVLAIIAWLLFSFLLQRLINRWRRKN